MGRRAVAFDVHLKDRALSISGSYEKAFEKDGVTYSHIMDPRTGYPATACRSVRREISGGTRKRNGRMLVPMPVVTNM